ncbi:MAG: hypothetical protein ABIJ56_21945 [Pseudomonadota bacterium]
MIQPMDESRLIEKLRLIEALFAGAETEGDGGGGRGIAGEPAAMKESFYDNMERISGVITQGRFPVPLPMATVFPMLARLYRADSEGKVEEKTLRKKVIIAVHCRRS